MKHNHQKWKKYKEMKEISERSDQKLRFEFGKLAANLVGDQKRPPLPIDVLCGLEYYIGEALRSDFGTAANR